MLPPANRLRKEKEIKRALASRNSCKSGLLICKTASNGLDAVRFCFVVSKRVSNKAAVRNRLKRRLREAVKVLLSRAKLGFDCVFIACPGLEAKDFDELAMTVKKILIRSSVLNNHLL